MVREGRVEQILPACRCFRGIVAVVDHADRRDRIGRTFALGDVRLGEVVDVADVLELRGVDRRQQAFLRANDLLAAGEVDDVELWRFLLGTQLREGVGRIGGHDLHGRAVLLFERRDDALLVRGLVGAAEGVDDEGLVLRERRAGRQRGDGECGDCEAGFHGRFPCWLRYFCRW